jgi:acyl-CoA reductase-like NAD-dependent aldehyde dehydrogenase
LSRPAEHRLFIAGGWREGGARTEIRSPWDSRVVAGVQLADRAAMEQAIEAAHVGFQAFRRTSRFYRSRLLAEIARGLEARRSELVASIIDEAGKPRALADAEVTRAIQTFSVASEEARRLGGEVIPVDWDAAGCAYSPAVSLWVPRGPVLAIAPFNFPLNLVAHKVAPALAVGAPVIIKPAPQAPGASCILARVFDEVALEDEARFALQWVQAPNEVVGRAVEDPRLPILSFTGSDTVGWMLQRQAIRKRLALELGGNAAVIVHSDADLARAAARCAFGAFAYAGQVCISVQRILVHESVLARFKELFLSEVTQIAKSRTGDPSDPNTLVGPVIDAGAADRILAWIEQAKASGARVLSGGGRRGQLIEPTVLEGVPAGEKLSCEEAFGPVVTLDGYADFSEAIARVNASRFGLQAGVFTDRASLVQQAVDELEVGGVLINEVPTYRADHLPYGGMKDSGLGREGLRYAMEEYCERRTLVQWVGPKGQAHLKLPR